MEFAEFSLMFVMLIEIVYTYNVYYAGVWEGLEV